MKCPQNENQCLTCIGTTCVCGNCEDAQKPCPEAKLRVPALGKPESPGKSAK